MSLAGYPLAGAPLAGQAGASNFPSEAEHVIPLLAFVETEAEHVIPIPLGQSEAEHVIPCSLYADGELVIPLPLVAEAEHTIPLTFATSTTADHVVPLPLGQSEAEHTVPLPLIAEAEHVIPAMLSGVSEAEHIVPLPLGIAEVELVVPLPLVAEAEQVIPAMMYALSEAEHIIPLPLGQSEAEHAIPLPLIAEAEHVIPVPMSGVSEAELVVPLPLGQTDAEHVIPLPLVSEAEHVIPVMMTAITEAEHIIPTLFSEISEAEQVVPLGFNAASEADLIIPLPLHIPSGHITTGTMQITVPGRAAIRIASADVSAAEGSPYWQAEITLADTNDFGKLQLDTAFALQLMTGSWSLVVRGRSVTRQMTAQGGPVRVAKITGLSPAYALSSDRAQGVNKTWIEPVMAKDSVEELIGPVTWQMINWPIPAYRLAAVNVAPLELAKRIIEAAGGRLESNADGSLYARRHWPVTVPKIATATPDHILPSYRVLETNEQATRDARMNRVRIVDVESSYQDKIEFTADENNGRRGIVRAYPYPWRPVQVTHTRGSPPVYLYADGEVNEQYTETVEFKEGVASVGYPVKSIASITWLAANLGGVAFAGSSLTADVAGYSLALITYNAQAYRYRAESLIDTQAQLLVENI